MLGILVHMRGYVWGVCGWRKVQGADQYVGKLAEVGAGATATTILERTGGATGT